MIQINIYDNIEIKEEKLALVMISCLSIIIKYVNDVIHIFNKISDFFTHIKSFRYTLLQSNISKNICIETIFSIHIINPIQKNPQ